MWYCFSLEGGYIGETVHMRITELNSVVKVYNGDLRPLVRIPSISNQWERYVSAVALFLAGEECQCYMVPM